MGGMSEAGRTFVVTGANAGIGRATAQELARRGGRVILACRSEEKTAPVVDDIVRDTGNSQVEYLHLDLGDLDSVRESAKELLTRDTPIHVLVNNAGVGGQRGETAQGFELNFGVNHLGHFLLTTLLLDRLRQCGPARVVNVSSDSHYQPKGIDFDSLRQPTKSFSGIAEYGVSKLANVLFTQEMARRVPSTELSASAVHPGVIASDIWRRVPWPIRPVMTLFMRSPERGAETSVWCATSPDLEGESGGFYANSRPKEPSGVATEELGRELWKRSEEWTAA